MLPLTVIDFNTDCTMQLTDTALLLVTFILVLGICEVVDYV